LTTPLRALPFEPFVAVVRGAELAALFVMAPLGALGDSAAPLRPVDHHADRPDPVHGRAEHPDARLDSFGDPHEGRLTPGGRLLNPVLRASRDHRGSMA